MASSFNFNDWDFGLGEDVAKSFEKIRILDIGDHSAISMDVNCDGRFIAICTTDDQIFVFDSETGNLKQIVPSQKYGADQARFIHSDCDLLHASTKVNDHIRLLSIQDSKYIRYFEGHDNSVTSIKMHPYEELFISASEDKTIKLWDMRDESFSNELTTSTAPVFSVDWTGSVLAVADGSQIDLYDLRSLSDGSFSQFSLPDSIGVSSDLEFSPKSDLLALTTFSSSLVVVDAYSGHLRFQADAESEIPRRFESSFSLGGEFVIRGDPNGVIPCYSTQSGRLVASYQTESKTAVATVRYHPELAMMFACSNQMTIWGPTKYVIEQKMRIYDMIRDSVGDKIEEDCETDE